jgi:hypothetical protein
LKAGARKLIKMKFVYPNVSDGDYSLLAVVDEPNAVTESNEGNNTGATASPITIRHAFVDLTGSVPVVPTTPIAAGQTLSASILLENLGSIAARGKVTFNLFAADPAGIAGDVPLGSKTLSVNVKPGAAKTVRVKLVRPASIAPGAYLLAVQVLPTLPLDDENSMNDRLLSVSVVTLG